MIIRARHHWFYYPFFKGYSRLMPALDFRQVNYHVHVEDRGWPVLMIGNHFSWWDGFIALRINMKLFRRKFHIMMLEEQLRERMFLNKAGAYSIRKSHRSMVESFAYTRELLSDPGNMAVMYPQGAIHSLYDHPFVFEKGWYNIIRKLETPVQLVFYHALVDYYAHRKPTLNLYVYGVEDERAGAEAVERTFNELFRQSLEIQRSYL